MDREVQTYSPARFYRGLIQSQQMALCGGPTSALSSMRCLRKKVEMLFAHLKRILKLDRLRLRGPNGARDEFLLAVTAQSLSKLAKLIPARRTSSQLESRSTQPSISPSV
jgi:hypothetical protein